LVCWVCWAIAAEASPVSPATSAIMLSLFIMLSLRAGDSASAGRSFDDEAPVRSHRLIDVTIGVISEYEFASALLGSVWYGIRRRHSFGKYLRSASND
jgi:hypothetical protein